MSDYIQKGIEVGDRAAEIGFDWPDVESALLKVSEETLELREAIEKESGVEEELGDLWFALINVTRKLGVDPEAVVNQAVDKFLRRYAFVEMKVAQTDGADLDQMERWWQEAKDQQI